jgi:hypothetical protein
MAQVRQKKQQRRKATSLALRALAVLIAGLLSLSSLGEIAHFLLVPHAICADHGELIEVSEVGGHAAPHADAPSSAPQVAPASGEGSGHDHCELLASHQRQLALPAVAPGAVVPVATGVLIALAGGETSRQPLPALALAPKTSPPPSLA